MIFCHEIKKKSIKSQLILKQFPLRIFSWYLIKKEGENKKAVSTNIIGLSWNLIMKKIS